MAESQSQHEEAAPDISSALVELSMALLRPAPVDEMAALILNHAKKVTGSAVGFVGYIDRETGRLVSPARSRDTWAQAQVSEKEMVIDEFRGLWGWVLENRQPLVVNEPAGDPRLKGLPEGHLAIHRFLSAPAMIGDDLYGQISVANPGRDYTARDLRVITHLASLYAVAIQRQRVEESLRRSHDELDARIQERTVALLQANELLMAEIDERKRVESELRISEERFRQLAEHIDHAVWMSEPDTQRILYVSPAYERIWGRSSQGVVERPESFLETVHPEDRDRLAGRLLSVEEWEEEYRIVRPDGEIRWIRTRAFPIENEAGEVYRMAGISEDTTAQRQAQMALFQAERLGIAGKLAASLAHEINNPLQSAIGCLDLAAEALAEGEDANPFLHVAADALQRASGVVQELRTLYRQAAPEEKKPVDVNSLIEKVLLLTKKQCETRGIEVTWQPEPGLPELTVMRDGVQQVFLNLVLNALDAMPQGGTLEVSTTWTDQPEGVRVRFADSGMGIEAEALGLIFDPFYSTKSEGLGLGLFISQNIVEQHGGQIEVASRVNEGTTFRVWLPA